MKQISLLLSALFVIGCAQERYVVIPDESGQSGSLLVKPRGKESVALDRPYALSTSGFWGIGKRSAEVQEVLLHAGIYCGVPCAVEAFRSAAEVVDGAPPA